MSRKTQARVFVPLMKVDEEQRLVFGKITAQEVDQSGEMMDYATSKPNFESWSAQIEQGSGGLSKGNLRVMHGLSVAGKLTELAYNDDDKTIEVCAKVVDDKEWEKVTEGCYTGFSVGGKYGKKWKETVDGETVTKFTAIPNEVSLVDNPCVKSATFQLVKAGGVAEEVLFKTTQEESSTEETPAEETTEETTEESVEKNHELPVAGEPSASAIAEKAGELAKAAGDNSTWQDHIDAAREELMKMSALQLAAEQEREAKKDEGGDKASETQETDAAAEGSGDKEADDDAEGGPAEKVTPAGVKQLWSASDGKTFEKKADCVAYEEELEKAAEPKTDADKLRERLNKAINPEEVQASEDLIDDPERMSKVFNVLETVRGGSFDVDVLKKGMYTVGDFSRVLCSLGSLQKRIAGEGKREGDDADDATVAADIKKAMGDLGEAFKVYVVDQVNELLAGLDDDTVTGCYDYYCCAAKEDGEDQLAKDVCSILEAYRDPSRERRDVLSKAFGYVEAELVEDGELSPPLKKRFDELEAENASFKKIAEDAVETVEQLTKRVETIEKTPLPRAPKNVALRPGDGTFLGKTANTEEEKLAVMHDLLKAKGPDALALELIKLAQSNPQHLQLKG